MTAPAPTKRRPSPLRPRLVAVIALVLMVTAVFLQLPHLWLGIFLGSGVMTIAALFGIFASTITLVATGLFIWLVSPASVNLATSEMLSLAALLLPVKVAGHLLHLRTLAGDRREVEGTRRTRLLTEAAMSLQKADNTEVLFRTVLRMLADILDFTHAHVFVPRDDAFTLLASRQWEVPSEFRLPLESVVGEAALSKEPLYIPDVRKHPNYIRGPNSPKTHSELAIPLMMEERVAAVLNIEHDSFDAFQPEVLRTLLAFGKMVEEALERVSLHTQLVEMLEAIRNLAQSDEPAQLFEETVKSAIRLIPGAEAGSLMLYEENEFEFVAAEGYDRFSLGKITGVSHRTQLRWYAGNEEDFVRGVPRLLEGAEIMLASMAGLDTDEQRATLVASGRLAEITANICVPISYGGKVLGMLNIDSFAASNPFGSHALLLAETFAQQIAVIIRQTLYRDALERAVITDGLTGLGNREGFNRQLNVELARARRYGQAFNLVMIDLDGFKRINDKVGHQAGDRALVQVGEAIKRERREGDSVFRWGGDEFALILPQVDSNQAFLVAERYRAAIARVRLGDHSLSASFGIASYPEDGSDAESLLRKADDLMYRHKSTEKATW
ncbi:MAG: sensor domain-containing diguanylate cyclase [Trueperaceae bacterium]